MKMCTAVIISYDDGVIFKNLLQEVIRSQVARIVVMIGGHNGESDFLKNIDDSRLIYESNNDRLGKCECLNRALKYVAGDYVFVISGDIELNHDIFEKLILCFSEDVGVIVPKVIPRKTPGLHGLVGDIIWKLHDVQLTYLSERGLNVHGGELIAIRRSLLNKLPLVVNDDAYLCISAKNSGYSVIYNNNVTVNNFLPTCIRDLVRQRIRINFGHQQLLRMKFNPLVMSTLLMTDRKVFFDIMRVYMRRHKRDALVLPMVFLIELLSVVIARIQIHQGKNYLIWPLVKRDFH